MRVLVTAGGTREPIDAVRVIANRSSGKQGYAVAAEAAARGILDPKHLTEAAFSERLDTGGLPDPDLVIRTSGEMRVSNFLLWQISYAELYVTSACWPDFDVARLHAAFSEYATRTRKYGGLASSDDSVGRTALGR